MKIIKRDGSEMEFDRSKIEAAVQKANESVDLYGKCSKNWIQVKGAMRNWWKHL